MYIVKNNVINKIIGEFKTDGEFIDFANKVRNMNGHYDFSILGVSDATEYIEDYCDHLELIDMNDLIDSVINQIKEDIGHSDLTAIVELLKSVPVENLKSYLPEPQK